MSTCISSLGEFGAHIPDGRFSCTRCYVLDEDGLRAELDRVNGELTDVKGNRDELFNGWQSALVELAEANRQREISDSVCAEAKSLLTRRTSTLKARAEHAEVERDKLHEQLGGLALVKLWTNEDGKRFAFADDIADAVGWAWMKDSAQPAPSNSQDWELDPATEERAAGKLDAAMDLWRRQADAGKAIVEAAKVWRMQFSPVSYLSPPAEALAAAVDAHAALESTPDASPFFLRELLAAVAPEGWTVLPEGHPAERDMIEAAYGLIACAWNVGNPPVEPVPGWNAAATRFRDWYHAWLDRTRSTPAAGEGLTETIHHGPAELKLVFCPSCPNVAMPITAVTYSCPKCVTTVTAELAPSTADGLERSHCVRCLDDECDGCFYCQQATLEAPSTADGPAEAGVWTEKVLDAAKVRAKELFAHLKPLIDDPGNSFTAAPSTADGPEHSRYTLDCGCWTDVINRTLYRCPEHDATGPVGPEQAETGGHCIRCSGGTCDGCFYCQQSAAAVPAGEVKA